MNGSRTANVPADGATLTQESQVIDIFLQPGEIYFGDENTCIRTILGSCVAITLWHAARRIGGMCHFVLPGKGHHHRRGGKLDGRYCDEAIYLLEREIIRSHTQLRDYEAKVFGGGNMFPGFISEARLIGQRNAETALHLLDMLGIRVTKRHLCGVGHRQVIFEVWSGDVWLKHLPTRQQYLAPNRINE